MRPSIPIPEDYDVSSFTGFLPAEYPLEVLPDPYYAKWEVIIKNLQGLLLSRRLRNIVNGLPILSTDHLHTQAEWRRAYSILAFITHAYIWGGDKPREVVPPSLSIPFLEVCEHLELPPVATYAAVVLWNFKPLFNDEPLDLENLSTLTTFTGSIDESWFFLVSTAIEAQGAPIIPAVLSAMAAAHDDDAATVISHLQFFAERIDELASILTRMYENCDPHVFYHRIRPFLSGGKNMADAGLPRGVLFDDGTETAEYVQLSGGSNAQSSIIQFFDIALGVDHHPTGTRPSSTTTTSSDEPPTAPPPSTSSPSHNFIADMRRYMPGPHRRFLEAVSDVANIRPYVESHRSNTALATAYDACLAMLRALRDAHIRIVSRYVVIQSREARGHAGGSPRAAPQRVGSGTSSREGSSPRRVLRGTGGTSLIPFLKQVRDETGEPAIGTWARRLLGGKPYGAPLGGVDEHANGQLEVVGLAGIWNVDESGSEGGICHW